MRGALRAALLVLALAMPAGAQTLGDIRAELSALAAELAALRAELSASGGGGGALGGGSVLDRVAAAESELARLTARTEELQIRIDRIVADGTNRIADLDFRLTELEGGDISAVGRGEPLGGEAGVPAPPPAPAAPEGVQLAVGEQAAFDAARAVHDAGDWAGAATALAGFAEAYPVGPLTADAHVLRADALTRMGETTAAARAWLDAFNAAPEGPRAPEALLALGRALAGMGQLSEGCIMLDEVGLRFPDRPEAAAALSARTELGCP
jgi:tol-pal system protein YbgF